MAFQSHDFPFTIMDVASLLQLRVRRRQADSVYVDCPFCGDNRGKMNIHLGKNVFRCNYCDERGGMLALYAKVHSIGTSEAYREICDALQTGSCTPAHPIHQAKVVQNSPPPVPQSELAGINTIHQTLSMLFSLLQLSDAHRQNLHNRGMTDEQIDRFGYKSTPAPNLCRSLTEQLMAQGCTLQGVPGFYLGDDDRWTVKFHKRTYGLLVPIRGIDGLLRGAQIRLDVPIRDEKDIKDGKEGTKYIWLSSLNKRMGVTSGSPVHFVGDPFARTVYVTEGALKGDAAHCLMNRSFACVAGANNLSLLGPLFAWLSQHGTKLIVEAHDMDKYRNKMIDKGASSIYIMAHDNKMECRRLTWNPNYKGVDDWQKALRKKRETQNNKEVCGLNFKKQFIAGLCDFDAIDDHVEAWHNSPDDGIGLPEYLGLTDDEYGAMLHNGYAHTEALLISQRKRQRFRVYQLDFNNENQIKPFAFQGITALRKAGFEQPPASEYRLVYDSDLLCNKALSDTDILTMIFSRINDRFPDDYLGRSISPSDVIELYDNDTRQYFYRNDGNFTSVSFSPMLARPLPVKA